MIQSGLITRGLTAGTILTRGLGTSSASTPIQRAVTAARRLIRGKSKQLKRIIVSARLLVVNDEEIIRKIQGNDIITFYEDTRYSGPRVIAKWISNGVKNAVNRIVIRASRIFGLDEN